MSAENPRGKGSAASGNGGEDNSSCECPTCGRNDFASERGMKMHHAKSHGESLRKIDFECSVCGTTDEKEPHHYNEDGVNYCSHDCQAEDLREETTVECDWCGEENTFSPPSTARRFCGPDCQWEYFRGETHPSYKGHPDSYGDQWWPQRRKARERDNYACQICGATKEDLGRLPHVHHIIPVRKFDDPNDAHDLDNLITLCPKHHTDWEGIPLKPEIV